MNRSTESKEKIQDAESRYKYVFENSLDGILILDADTLKVIEINPSAVRIFEVSQDEILGKELWEIGLFKNKNESLTVFRNLKSAGFIDYQELSFDTKAGNHREIEFIGSLYSVGAQQVIQCNVRDITKRKDLKKQREQLIQESEFLAQIASRTARIGGWTIDLPERTLTWSDENCVIHEVPLGYKPTLEEGIGYFPPEYREQVIRCVEKCAEDGTPYDFELPKYTAKGNLIWVRSIGEAVRDTDGKIIRLQGAFQDITAQKQAEKEKEKLIKELQEALAEVKTLREFLPICSYCKKIRDDQNYWLQIDNYISRHTDTKFSHGICPDCYELEVIPKLEQMKQERVSDS